MSRSFIHTNTLAQTLSHTNTQSHTKTQIQTHAHLTHQTHAHSNTPSLSLEECFHIHFFPSELQSSTIWVSSEVPNTLKQIPIFSVSVCVCVCVCVDVHQRERERESLCLCYSQILLANNAGFISLPAFTEEWIDEFSRIVVAIPFLVVLDLDWGWKLEKNVLDFDVSGETCFCKRWWWW